MFSIFPQWIPANHVKISAVQILDQRQLLHQILAHQIQSFQTLMPHQHHQRPPPQTINHHMIYGKNLRLRIMTFGMAHVRV